MPTRIISTPSTVQALTDRESYENPRQIRTRKSQSVGILAFSVNVPSELFKTSYADEHSDAAIFYHPAALFIQDVVRILMSIMLSPYM